MRTIEKDEIKDISKLKFNTTPNNKSTFFFPITEGATVDNGMFEMTVKSDRYSATAGLVVGRFSDSKNLEVFLAYTNLNLSPSFNIVQYADITDTKLSKQELTKLSSLQCYLVDVDNILSQFII